MLYHILLLYIIFLYLILHYIILYNIILYYILRLLGISGKLGGAPRIEDLVQEGLEAQGGDGAAWFWVADIDGRVKI